MSAKEFQVPSLDNTFGAMLIGTYIATMIYGLTTHQTYRYFRLYPSDSWGLKGMVVCLWALDSLSTVLNLHCCYYYLVTLYSKPESLLEAVWYIPLRIRVFVAHNQLPYAQVVSIGGRHKLDRDCDRAFVFDPSCLSSWSQYLSDGSSNSSGHRAARFRICPERYWFLLCRFILGNFKRFSDFTWLICTTLGLSVASDALITIALCFSLQKSRTGYKRTDSLIDILMVYAINTGLLTTLFTLATLICAALMPENLIYFAILTVVTKLHPNSLLAVLNSRRSIVDRGAEGFETGSFGLKNRAERRPSIHWEPAHSPSGERMKVCIPFAVFREPTLTIKSWKRTGLPSVIDVVVTTETFRQGDSEIQTKAHEDQSSTVDEPF
ncbi:hypothetical protein A0H81_03426 [Grifola frondosa]|uniref:DUF6534 domain-containing protein n=1 Tax=Grifola frondosa TaxID=5627 RepID=A0A1C7MK21_GRIFR|nr:hypothetical protein A0H81_03426 [Grifola frondosa]